MKYATVAAFEAKNKLGQLLDRVVAGDVITITRHGAPVARLVPFVQPFDREDALKAAERLLEISKLCSTPEGMTIRQMIEEGRR